MYRCCRQVANVSTTDKLWFRVVDNTFVPQAYSCFTLNLNAEVLTICTVVAKRNSSFWSYFRVTPLRREAK